MTMQLIQGNFSKKDALDIIAQMIEVKIKFHENKIAAQSHEEDIKYRESKIKKLQHELKEAREFMFTQNENLNLEASILIS